MKLFDDNENDNDDISKIEVDDEYARRFEHNKKREELQRYEELKKRGEIDEPDSKSYFESSDEEDDAEIDKLSKKEDIKKLFENLIKVKDHHPSVYQPVNLFGSESESETESESDGDVKEENENRRKKPKYLKDVVAQHLIEEGPEFDDVESNKKKTYNEEQEELRKAFLDEVKNLEKDGDGDDLLKVKEKTDENEGQDDDEEFQKKLGEYFGPDDALDENSKFLKDYFEKQMWIDRENTTRIDEREVDVVSDEDEEYWEQEDYERDYNFRYEENAGDRVMGHSRIVEGSVRKEKNSRKEQRKNKMERMKVAEMERKEELKHLKNLKKKEMKEKLKKVMEVAGVTDENDFGLDLDDLEEEFDPAVYDSKMNKAFGDKYYDANDADPGFGSDEDGDIEKPDFDKEDELLGLPKGWDEVGNDDGFSAARKRALEKIPEDNDHNIEEEEDDDENDDEDEESNTDSDDSNDDEETKEEERETEVAKDEEITKKRKRKEKVSLVQRAKEAMLDEYYKLDYEDTIGDLKTRFKYAKVKPNRYGLKAEELLSLDDKDLNQYVSVKKIAPYREDEWKVPGNKKQEYKEKARELLRGKWNHGTSSKKRSLDKGDKSKAVSDQEKKPETEGTNVEEANLSRNKKRKLRQKELKLSKSRLAAYQNVQQKASGKRKS